MVNTEFISKYLMALTHTTGVRSVCAVKLVVAKATHTHTHTGTHTHTQTHLSVHTADLPGRPCDHNSLPNPLQMLCFSEAEGPQQEALPTQTGMQQRMPITFLPPFLLKRMVPGPITYQTRPFWILYSAYVTLTGGWLLVSALMGDLWSQQTSLSPRK